jgi:membrane associated rhomboid family serine protease
MFLPIHDDNPRRSAPIVTLLLIGITLIVWFLVQGAGDAVPLARSVCELGMIPGELTGRAAGELVPLGHGLVCVVDARPAWHTVLTSMFLHGDWLHLIGNLWFLWLFGDNVEDELGHGGFAVFYVLCGIAAAAAQLVVDPSAAVPMVGASGAISGVMGAYIVRFPRAPVRVLAILIIFLTTFRVPAFVMLGYWFLLQVLGGLPQLGGNAAAGVAFWAHVGGFVAGVLIALALGPRMSATRRRRPLYDDDDDDGYGHGYGYGGGYGGGYGHGYSHVDPRLRRRV